MPGHCRKSGNVSVCWTAACSSWTKTLAWAPSPSTRPNDAEDGRHLARIFVSFRRRGASPTTVTFGAASTTPGPTDELGMVTDVVTGFNRGGSAAGVLDQGGQRLRLHHHWINVNDVNGDVVSVPLNDGDLETWNIGWTDSRSDLRHSMLPLRLVAVGTRSPTRLRVTANKRPRKAHSLLWAGLASVAKPAEPAQGERCSQSHKEIQANE